jgi:hypothetical protein
MIDIPPRDELVVEGPAAREPQVTECEHGNGPNGRHRAKSQSESTLSVQDAPTNLPSPRSGSIAGRWLPNICRIGPIDWFK